MISSSRRIALRTTAGCFALLSCFCLTTAALGAAVAGSGEIQGRVLNAASGAALLHAHVSVAGTAQEAYTDESGFFHLYNVPAGGAEVRVDYTGLPSRNATVQVTSGSAAQQDFSLSASATVPGSDTGQPLKLEQFTVIADNQMSAQALSLNERKSAPNISNVVAYDEFGDRGDENIGEFLRFLPGVFIDDGGQIASTLSLRGFPANYSTIMLDGAPIASARGNSRAQSLLDVSMGSMSRAEISKEPTPDMPASGLGGSVNLVTLSGLQASKAAYSYQAYFISDGHTGLKLDAGPRGLSDKLSPNTQKPSFSFNGLVPVTKNFAISFGGSSTWRLKPMERDGYLDTQPDWNLVNGVQRVSTWLSLDNILKTDSAQLGFGWRISPENTLTFAVSHRYVSNNIMRDSFIATYGAGATGDRGSVQSAMANGSVAQGGGTNQETGTDTTHSTLKFAHVSKDWRVEAFGTFSRSESFLDDVDNGHFNAAAISTGAVLKLTGTGIGADDRRIPTTYSAVNAAGTAVDIFNASNYAIASATSAQNHIQAKSYGGHLDVTREFSRSFPLSVKSGVFWNRLDRDQRGYNKTWSFNPNGLTTTAARTATNFEVFDQSFLQTAPTIFGHPMQWVSLVKLYDLYKAHPDWFVLDQPGYIQNIANNSRKLSETISAGYVRADAKLMDGKFWVVGGLRYERTEEDGYGPSNDPSAQYQKTASGGLILDATGNPILISTDPIVRAQLRYKERGAHSNSTYDNVYPSLNLTYKLTDKIYLRAAYSRTIGRPDYGSLIPGVTISDPGTGSTRPTITVNNAALKPLTADNFDFSLESYEFKGGSGSIGVFHKSIKDFFGSVTQAATPELLAFYGLPNDPFYANSDIVTTSNAGDAKMTGYEFTYTQSLLFLPDWARGLQVFVNATKLDVDGSNTADFTGFAPEKYSGGINFVRPRFSVRANFTYQGETRGALVAASAANGIPAGTYDYQGERFRVGANAQYSLNRAFVLFASMSDIGNFLVVNRRYADGTPGYLKDRRRQELGSTIMLGVKGRF